MKEDDLELSDSTKKELAKARTTPLNRYISHEDVLSKCELKWIKKASEGPFLTKSEFLKIHPELSASIDEE
jgi:hypothetical protein